MSVTHIHLDDHHSIETSHQVTELDQHCIICSSIVKYTTAVQLDVSDCSIPQISFVTNLPVLVEAPVLRTYIGRAPPA